MERVDRLERRVAWSWILVAVLGWWHHRTVQYLERDLAGLTVETGRVEREAIRARPAGDYPELFEVNDFRSVTDPDPAECEP